MTNYDLLDIYAAGHSASSPPVPEGCSQIFAGCYDIHCQRTCSAHRPYTAVAKAITADMVAAKQKTVLLQYFAAFLAIGILITGAAYLGLSRAEHAYQIERV